MKEHNEKKYIINERILALRNLLIETERNITQLNVLVSEHVTARDNEIKKKETLQENVDKLEVVFKKLIKSNKSSMKGAHTEFVTDKETDKELENLIKKLKKSD